jgi:acetyl/propionyl-CoA carboxylase alpha subunit
MDEKLRHEMGECAKTIALASGYSNAGTVEFMVEENKNFYFLEVNTRLQVEHPITEMRTGLDLVAEQIKIASGEKLRFKQDDIEFKGAAIECRICAEDPDNNFLPSTGKLEYIFRTSGNGMREDTGIEQGNEISIYYDSMISKLISYGENREIAIYKMKRALRDYKVRGVKTNINFLLNLLGSKAFMEGKYNTQYVEKYFLPELINKKMEIDDETLVTLSLASILFKEKQESKTATKQALKTSVKSNGWSSQRKAGYR